MNHLIHGALLTSCALALASPAALAQGTATPITGVTNGELTPDGAFVAGFDFTNGSYLWNPVTGFNYNPTGTVFPEDVSSGGLRVAGSLFDTIIGADAPGYWDTLLNTETSFGQHPSLGGGCPDHGNARVVSHDGQTFAGMVWDGCSVDPFTWTATGGYNLLNEGLGTSTQVTAMSGDGTWFGGWSQSGSLSFETCYLWDSAGNLTLPLTRTENPGGNGKINGMDLDGDSFVGRDIATAGTTGFLMYEGTLMPIAGHSESYCVSGDGRIVGGAMGGGGPFGPPPAGQIFTTWGGNMDALSFFAQFGVTPPAGALNFGAVLDISTDGNTFLLGPDDPFFGQATHVSLPNSWADLGGGTLGSNGFPTLDGFGWLNPGMTAGIALDNAATGSLGFLVYGGTYNPTPLYGGTVGPFPWDGFLAFPTGANGEVEFTFTWPLTMPSGANLYMQFGIYDPGFGVSDVVLSNNLQATGN